MKEVLTEFEFTSNTAVSSRTEYLGNAKISALKTVQAHSETRSVDTLLRNRVLNAKVEDLDSEDAFYVADLGEVVRQQLQWKELLPRVEPFYAVKCNPDLEVVRTLVGLGTGFDCASRAEIQMVLDMGVDPSKIIYANPCKQQSHIRYAASKGVTMMTFDNADELYKIKKLMPHAQMVLRILADDSKSVCRFGVKFGASMARVPSLLKAAQDLDINLIGVSFHVGSGCFDSMVYDDAVRRAAFVMSEARKYGFEMNFLDLGGGFPCNGGSEVNGLQFPEIASVLRRAIEEVIPAHIRIIAEPGRYYVASAFTLACNVTARRVVPRDIGEAPSPSDSDMMGSPTSIRSSYGDDHPSFMYYINDGMYGSFNCITFDHVNPIARVLMRGGQYHYKQSVEDVDYPCSIWGPTCDSIDCITRDGLLPDMDVGDWMYFDHMGAYTMAAASSFNGFKKSTVIYTNTFSHHEISARSA